MAEISLTTDQKKAYEYISDWYSSTNRKPYFKLGGLAGTGKTTLINYFRTKLGLEEVKFAAYTGKAAFVMQKKGISNASTLHSLLYKPVIDGNTVRYEKKNINEVKCQLIVVDEASMVDKQLFEDLLSFETPIIFCGDYGQLPPINENIGLMEEDQLDAKLETICRQEANSPIIKWSRKVRDGYKIPYMEVEGFCKIPYEDLDVEAFDYVDQVICGYNRTKNYLNSSMREYYGINSIYPTEGEKLIVTDNNSNFGVFNGQGIIVTQDMQIDKKSALSQEKLKIGNLHFCNDYDWDNFADKARIIQETSEKMKDNSDNSFTSLMSLINEYEHSGEFFLWPFNGNAELGDLYPSERKKGIIADFAYAITCHKSQGSEWDKVLIIDEWSRRDMDTRIKWLYTAITRGAKEVIITDRFYMDE